jgi:hypothetical protein
MVQFPNPIVQQIILTDANGNPIIIIGPQPSIVIQGPPPAPVPKIELTTNGAFPEIAFTDDDGTQRWQLQSIASAGPPWIFRVGHNSSLATSGPYIDFIEDTLSAFSPGINYMAGKDGGALAKGAVQKTSDAYFYRIDNSITPTGTQDWTQISLPVGYGQIQFAATKLMIDGTVAMRGVILANVSPIPAGTVIGTVASGHRPVVDTLVGCVFDSSGTHGRLVIRSATGNIECYEAPNARPALDCIRYPVV